MIRCNRTIFGAPDGFLTYVYDQDGVVLIENFNVSQNLIGGQSYSYDNEGNLKSQIFFDESRNDLRKFEFGYDGDRIANATVFQSDGQGGNIQLNIEYSYVEESNNLIEEKYTNPADGSLLITTTYEFDQNL